MIPFLVKLANLLDDRGQHKMAREVDDLIEKLAAGKRSMDLIRLIQHAVGAPEVNGQWDAATNSAFISYMNKYLPVAMKDNVFVGPEIDDKGTRAGNTLADAWELIKEQGHGQEELAQEMANKPKEQQGPASKAPAAKAPAKPGTWKSKYFQMTPNALQLLAKLDAKDGPGAGQNIINVFDRTPNQTQQDFESMLAEYANRA